MASRRVWTELFRQARPNAKRKTPAPPKSDVWRIVRGDRVQVIGGREEGTRGNVLRVIRDSGNAIVEGVRLRKRFQPSQTDDEPGRYFEFEAPLNLSRLALIDPEDGKPTKITWGKNEKGERIRISKRSGKEIPKPTWSRTSADPDGFDRSKAPENSCDTEAYNFGLKTYTPSARTFEEDALEAYSLAQKSADV